MINLIQYASEKEACFLPSLPIQQSVHGVGSKVSTNMPTRFWWFQKSAA